MTASNVTRVFSPDEALAFVIERGVITMPIAELAAAWAGRTVPRSTGRSIDGPETGLIERRGRVIRAPAADEAVAKAIRRRATQPNVSFGSGMPKRLPLPAGKSTREHMGRIVPTGDMRRVTPDVARNGLACRVRHA